MLRRRGDNAGLNSSRDKFVNPITRPIIILIHLSVCVCVCVIRRFTRVCVEKLRKMVKLARITCGDGAND